VTSLPDVPSGATWRCVDLHLHSPGVPTFTLPGAVDVHQQGDRERLADQYVERLRAARIDVAAITDYQGVRTDWYSRSPIDDATVRGEIRTIPEGGADAFRRRAEKYGGLDDA